MYSFIKIYSLFFWPLTLCQIYDVAFLLKNLEIAGLEGRTSSLIVFWRASIH